MDFKEWNNGLKYLRSIINQKDLLEESKQVLLQLHEWVHFSDMSSCNVKTLADELWDGLDEGTFKSAVNEEKGRTIAYSIYHSSRIEDITMNCLVSSSEQVFLSHNWKERINSMISDTGNALTREEIIELSKGISMEELKNYRNEVGRKTRHLIQNLNFSDLKRKFTSEQLQRIIDQGAVLNASRWLVDYWGTKNVAGILFMPVTRHHVVHLHEALIAKNKKQK